jgi:hypothetical protein
MAADPGGSFKGRHFRAEVIRICSTRGEDGLAAEGFANRLREHAKSLGAGVIGSVLRSRNGGELKVQLAD